MFIQKWQRFCDLSSYLKPNVNAGNVLATLFHVMKSDLVCLTPKWQKHNFTRTIDKKTQLKSYSGGGRVKAMTSGFNLIAVRCGRFSLNNNDLNLDRFLSQAIVGIVVLEYSAQVMDYFYDFLMVLLGDWRPCSLFNNNIWKRW